MRFSEAFRANTRPPALQMVKTALATMLAWVVTGLLIPDGPPPVFAAIAAMLVVQPSLNQSLAKAVERSVGVIAGVTLATLLVRAFGDASWVVLIAVGTALALAWSLRMTTGSANQVAISALLVLALGASTPDYAVDRVIETFIGALIGLVVHLALVPPVAVEPARQALENLGEEVAVTLERLSVALSRNHTPRELYALLQAARELRPMRDETERALDEARDSLTLNPRARRYAHELDRLRESLEVLTPIVTQVLGMTRAYVDQYDDGVHEEAAVEGIAEELRRAALDTRRHLRLAVSETSAAALGSPALTAPLSLGAPSGTRWILIGALMEDLRRIRLELGARA